MDQYERFEFDRQGYIVIKEFLTNDEVGALANAVDELEQHAIMNLHNPPRKTALWGPEYHHNEERGYYVNGSTGKGGTIIIEDFFNADPVFDLLVDHPKTMKYIHGIVQDQVRINNSEIRIRYPGNASGSHMGGPIGPKYRYNFNAKGIDCMMVRMVYFLHDVTNDHGAFCVIPGTHKTNLPSPYGISNPDEEPGMIGLEVNAGDAILFTENLRHGGLTNKKNNARKTLHVGYGPAWMMSQNIATMDEPQYVTASTLARYSTEQRKLFQIQGK